MPIHSHAVLSFLVESAAQTQANHREYAQQRGYVHRCIDASRGPRGLQVQCLHKYEALLDMLSEVDEGALVLLLSENAAIVQGVSLESLMADRDHLLVSIDELRPQTHVQVWRNTPAVRQTVADILRRCALGGEAFAGEAALLSGLTLHHWHAAIDGVCPVMNTGPNIDPYWCRTPTFAICVSPEKQSPAELGTVARFRDVLAGYINRCVAHGLPWFAPDSSDYGQAEERSTYGAGRPVALVTLYTDNIASYGRLAEHNLRQYCERHGYTLYVHRAMPAEIGLSGTGNWVKPWLLHGYLPHHDWVVWVDADVLVLDHDRPIEPLLEGREWLLARDIGQWPFNSGVMGFRRTTANLSVLYGLMERIVSLPDRENVYAHNGDQYFFIEAMRRHGLLDEARVLSLLEINTPWFLANEESFLVHYYGMWTEMRLLMMAHDEARRRSRASAAVE
jgi:hypothetical protein